ncbi:MAG: hypothetical protein D3903_01000 [Candidatus Electrothrix sp. GM3_4]|nr:hypothetical protein [Candidatus Electrothrix sp. GM3_4]
MNNKLNNKDGEQDVTQGEHDVALNYNNNGVAPEVFAPYKELLHRLETVQSEDSEVVRLKQEAIEAGDYAKAEALLNQAAARDMEGIEQLGAAASYVDNAKLLAAVQDKLPNHCWRRSGPKSRAGRGNDASCPYVVFGKAHLP